MKKKTPIVTKLQLWQLKNSKCDETQIVTKLKNSNCDNIQKQKNCDNIQKLKLWQNLNNEKYQFMKKTN